MSLGALFSNISQLGIYIKFGTKGQIISKGFFGVFDFLQKTNEGIRLYYYDTSSRLVFVRFLEETEDTKKPFRNYLTFTKNDLSGSPYSLSALNREVLIAKFFDPKEFLWLLSLIHMLGQH